ncbi:MAG: heme-binding protein [Hyphomicrobiales bacterium]|jgi:glc operon protein GlcG|nr:heme-binding protein [Hyphomicrobiales bacterium]
MRQELTLSDHDARIAVEVIRAETEKRGKSAVIAVVDSRGELISLLRMDGAAFSSVNVATNKAFTAARLKRPSSLIGRNARHPETGFNISYYSDPRYIGFSGGLPVIIDGQTVGAVAVSGLTEAEDEELAELAITAIRAANS